METHQITELLADWKRGDPEALEQLIPLVVDDLRRLARSYVHRDGGDATLQPTALINELYLHLHGRHQLSFPDRDHFFSFAATTMRNILVDYARAGRTAKRGGDGQRVPLLEAAGLAMEREIDLLALDEALSELAELDERQARIVELRAFAGLEIRETAEVLRVSEATVSRGWALAKAFLYRRLGSRPDR
ncbi:MAG: sigma-70 family RNA polymerase sigma factor [bacterium]|nr:sigma-70 family RNA polymerase sigma factor [bacterium]